MCVASCVRVYVLVRVFLSVRVFFCIFFIIRFKFEVVVQLFKILSVFFK